MKMTHWKRGLALDVIFIFSVYELKNILKKMYVILNFQNAVEEK